MEQLTNWELFYGITVMIVAYFIRGIAGFGSGLIAIPLLALVLPLTVVVPMIGVIDYIASTAHGARYRRDICWHDLLPVLPFTLIGVLVALYIFHTVDAELLAKGLGIFILLYALYSLLPIGENQRGSRWWAIPAGSLGGGISTLFGTGGPFYVIYLKLRGLDKAQFRATVAMAFIIDGGLRIIGYFGAGFFDLKTSILIATGIPIMILGMYLGGHIHTSISQQNFQRLISLLLIGSGIALLLK